MYSLYRHDKIKCFLSLTHGEGFGLPIFEAACAGIPVICPGWSGQNDYLWIPETTGKKKKTKQKPHFANVDFSLEPVPDYAIWPGVINEGVMWCEPAQGSYKMRLRQVRKNYDKWKKKSIKLQDWIIENFSEEKQYKAFALALDPFYIDNSDLTKWLEDLNAQEFE